MPQIRVPILGIRAQQSKKNHAKVEMIYRNTLQGTNVSPKNGILKMIFLFPRWDMLIPWRV